jgi:L-alanine-DL-glutamate epimerase-like enolase superfamily enzyme
MWHPAQPYWMECMIAERPSRSPAVSRLMAIMAHELGMRTAGGEMIEGTDQATAICAGKLYCVLMPDIKYAGGYSGMFAIADVCAAHGVAFAPHNPTGPMAHLACIHLCAAAPMLLWLEHQWNETPMFDPLVGGSVAPLVDGAFAVPVASGLGAALDLRWPDPIHGNPPPPARTSTPAWGNDDGLGESPSRRIMRRRSALTRCVRMASSGIAHSI